METLDYLKIKTDETNENILNACILDAQDLIKGYCHIKSIPDTLKVIERKLALMYFNQRGVEGTVSYSEGGVSATFISELSKDDRSVLNRYRRIEVGEYVEENPT